MALKQLQLLFTHRVSALLLFLSECVFLFVLPVIENAPLWSFRLCMSFVLLFAILSLEKVKKYFVICGFAAVLLYWFSDFGQNYYYNHYLELTTFAFVLWTVISLMLKFLRQKQVEMYSLLEAINGYLLLGILFSSIAVLLHNQVPGSFQTSTGTLGKHDLIYYTLVTLTTTGYGDVLPLSPGAKNLAMIIAVCGQIYVAFLVGVLVGKYTHQLTRKQEE